MWIVSPIVTIISLLFYLYEAFMRSRLASNPIWLCLLCLDEQAYQIQWR